METENKKLMDLKNRKGLIILLLIFSLFSYVCKSTNTKDDDSSSNSTGITNQKKTSSSKDIDANSEDFNYEEYEAGKNPESSNSKKLEGSENTNTALHKKKKPKSEDNIETTANPDYSLEKSNSNDSVFYTGQKNNRNKNKNTSIGKTENEDSSISSSKNDSKKDSATQRNTNSDNNNLDDNNNLADSKNNSSNYKKKSNTSAVAQSNDSNNDATTENKTNQNLNNSKKSESVATATLSQNNSFETEEIKTYDTYQFSIQKGNRLKSFYTINGEGKDYHFVKSPNPNSHQFYFLTNRVDPVIRPKYGIKDKPSNDIKNEYGEEAYTLLEQMLGKASSSKGTGLLEIVVCDYKLINGKEIFYNPRFTNIKDKQKGDKLGFALYYNQSSGSLELYYSNGEDLFKVISKDGENFSEPEALFGLNSEFMERDPSISPDGKMIAFASSRLRSSNIDGTHLFYSIRENGNNPFTNPKPILDAYNSTGDLFPSIFSSNDRNFIFFKKFSKTPSGSYKEIMASVEIVGKNAFPVVPFSDGSEVPFKYLNISYNVENTIKITSSYPINDYDLFSLHLNKKKIYIDSTGKITTNNKQENF